MATDLSHIGTMEFPIRPSKAQKFLTCPMAAVMSILDDKDTAGAAAQTGSAVHKAVEVFHRTAGTPITRQEAAAAEVERLRAAGEFPKAKWPTVRKWTAAYAADEKNISADLAGIELPVRLERNGVFFAGTLDQIRIEFPLPFDAEEEVWFQTIRDTPLDIEVLRQYNTWCQERDRGFDLKLPVWDLKTGTLLEVQEARAEYQVQQAVYVCAARETLGLPIVPGGLLWAAGYDSPMMSKQIPLDVTVQQCYKLVDSVADVVRRMRNGDRVFSPSAGHCCDGPRGCPHGSYPRCESKWETMV